MKPMNGISLGIIFTIMLLAGVLPATDYFVDFTAGNNTNAGTNASSPWKHAPGDADATGIPGTIVLLPGDRVLFRGGVEYRGSVSIPASGTAGNPIIYKGDGWGTSKAVLDGSETVSGWTRCSSAADCFGNPHWQSIYFAAIPDTVPWSAANLHEDGRFLYVAQEPDMPDPFFNDANAHFFQLASGQMTTTGITDPARFDQPDADYWNDSSVLAYVLPNVVVLRSIQSYIPAQNRIVYDSPTNDPAGYDRYSIYNSPHAIDSPGEYFCDPRASGGTRRVYLWPRDPAALENGLISVSRRRFGVDIGARSHVVIEGFEIRQFAGSFLIDGIGIGCHTAAHIAKSDITVRNNFIHDNLHPDGGYGGVYLSHCADSRVENNVIRENMKHSGITVVSSQRVMVSGNTCHRAGGTTLKFYTCTDLQVIRNTVTEGKGTHANGMTFYLSCSNVLADGNRVVDSNICLTYQESNNLTFINNIFDGADHTSFVVASWSGNTGTVNLINNTIVGSTSDYSLYISAEDPASYRIKNNVIDGGGGPNSDHTHNIYTARAWNQQPFASGEFLETDLNAIFVDPANRDYRLKPGSPAIDSGTDTRAYMPVNLFPGYDFQRDIIQTTRPQGTSWDIGAYEFSDSPPQPQTFFLVPGWNWISFNVLPADRSLNSVFSGIQAQVDQVKTQAQSALRLNGSWVGDLQNMDGIQQGRMYKVRVTAACTLTVTGTPIVATTPISLVSGWNWVAYFPTTLLPISQALASIAGQAQQAKSQTQSAIYQNGQWLGDLTQLEPGKGYTIRMTDPVVLIYPGAQ